MLEVLFEDNHLIAINKPSGVLVQGDKTGDTPLSDLVKAYLVKKYHKPGDAYLGVIHRIDRPTKGIVLFAKTSKALTRMNKAFADRTPKKKYWAIVAGELTTDEFKLEHWLLKKPANNKSYAHEKEVSGSKKGILSAKRLASSEHYHLLEIELETGRHHQIRSQLSKFGLPIRGDLKYGAKRSNSDGGIDLLAKSLSFKHPVTKETILINCPNPRSGAWKHFNF